MGRDSVERELKKWRLELSRVEKDNEIIKFSQELGFRAEDDFYAAVGYGRVSPKTVVTRLVPPQEREKAKGTYSEERPFKSESGTKKSGVKVQGLINVMVNFAKCCNPLPGDPLKDL